MTETVKSVLIGILITALIVLLATMLCMMFHELMGIIAGFFAWIVIQLAVLG